MIRAALCLLMLLPDTGVANCRQALALGLDVSGSVDAREYQLQLHGVAEALESRDVQAILLRTGVAPVRLAVYEWSGPADQTLILPWTSIHDVGSLVEIANTLRRFERAPASPTTALGAAIMTGVALLNDQSTCWVRTLDISGDGKANTGPRPQDLEDTAIPTDITINALVIGAGDAAIGDRRLEDIKELSSYFNSYVIRGANAFVETAIGFENYASAMERKLLRELTSLAIGQGPSRPEPAAADIFQPYSP